MEIPRDTEHEAMGKTPRRGMWCRWATYTTIGCPDCGRPFHVNAHGIGPDGRLKPSVVCPQRPCCAFHVDGVVLLGWSA